MLNHYVSLDEFELSQRDVKKEWCAVCDAAIYPDSVHFSGGTIEGLGACCLKCLLAEQESGAV